MLLFEINEQCRCVIMSIQMISSKKHYIFIHLALMADTVTNINIIGVFSHFLFIVTVKRTKNCVKNILVNCSYILPSSIKITLFQQLLHRLIPLTLQTQTHLPVNTYLISLSIKHNKHKIWCLHTTHVHTKHHYTRELTSFLSIHHLPDWILIIIIIIISNYN